MKAYNNPNVREVKKKIKSLKAEAAKEGIFLKHASWLEQAALTAGFRDWNTYCAFLKKNAKGSGDL